PTPEIYTLSLHDALPIFRSALASRRRLLGGRGLVRRSGLGHLAHQSLALVPAAPARELVRRAPAEDSASAGGRRVRNGASDWCRSEEHTSELQSRRDLVC